MADYCRLLFWDHLSDQGSFILCPPDAELDGMTVYKAGLPVLAPPDTAPTPEPHNASLDASSSRKMGDALPERDIDNSELRTDEPVKGMSKFDRPLTVDSAECLEVDHVDLNAFEGSVITLFISSIFLRRSAVKRVQLMILMLIFRWIQPSLENKPLLTSTYQVKK